MCTCRVLSASRSNYDVEGKSVELMKYDIFRCIPTTIKFNSLVLIFVPGANAIIYINNASLVISSFFTI